MSFSASIENIRKALDSSAIVAITDTRGIIKHVNAKFVEISQYSEQELLGQNHRIISSGYHSKEFFQELWAAILQGQRWEGEIRNRAKDGSHYWVHTTIVPFANDQGQVEEFVSIRWDVTDRKEAEEKLLATKENLQSLIDASFEGLLVYDLSGSLRWCNSSVESIFKLPMAQLLRTPVEAILGKRYTPFSEDMQNLSVVIGGESKILEVSTKPYHYRNHRAYLVTLRDVTEKAQMESKILQQERLASVGILASGLAHEIGTPLGIVRGRAEMMGAQEIIQQIDRVSHLIQNLLKLARGQDTEVPVKVHILSLLSDMDDFLKYELRKNNISIQIEVPDRFEVVAVYNSLFQVVLNLLVNAVHAIQDKAAKGAHEPGLIRVWAESQEMVNILHFADNGCGMTDEVMRNLFTPFFSTKEIGKGTGLGLATSYKILQSWGGFLIASSQQGVGTTMSIHMPRPSL